MKRARRQPAFESEAALCAAFATVATCAGWTVYNETGGWDQLLVNAAGEQIGVQAKLRCTIGVLHQALEWAAKGKCRPDWRMVLVGVDDAAFRLICRHAHLLCVTPGPAWRTDSGMVFPSDEMLARHRWPTEKRHQLPAYIPDVPAGVPCPVQLTPWKVKAIRICQILRVRGTVSRADFKAVGINPQRWLDTWLQQHDGRRGVYVARNGVRLPDEDHPQVSVQIRKEVELLEKPL